MKLACASASLLAFALFLSPAIVRADEKADSFRAHVQRAKDLYSHGSYEAAAQEYILAWQINPVPGALFNIAQAYRQAGKYEQSRQYFRSYLREKKPEAAERAQVEKQISELNGLIAKEKKSGSFEPSAASNDDFAPPVVARAKPAVQALPPVAKKTTDDDFAPAVVATRPAAPAPAPVAPPAKKKADDDFAPPVVAVKPPPPAPVVAPPRAPATVAAAPAPVAKKKTDDDFAPPPVAPKPVPAPPVVAPKPVPAPLAAATKKPVDDFAPAPAGRVVVASPPAPAPISNRKMKAATAPAPVVAHDDFAPPPPPKAPPAKVVVAAPPKPYVAEAPPLAVPDDAVIETRSSARGHTWAYATGGAALALIGTGVYFGVQATRADNELTAGPHSRADGDSLISKSHNDHRLEAIFLGVGGAAVVGAGLLYFLPASGPSGGSGAAVAGHF